jgi:tetratricopeptide (TPR) repeat protein
MTAVGSAAWWTRLVDPERLFREARDQLGAGHLDRAEASMNRLERLRPLNPFDRLLRAQIHERRRRPDAAVAELERVDPSHPLAPVALILAGQIEIRRHRLRAAEAYFLRALALEPKAVQPRRELIFVYNIQQRQADLDAQLLALSRLNDLSYDQLVHWGKTRNVVWNAERDVENLYKVIQADPDDRWSRLSLAEGLRRLSRLDDAELVLSPLPPSDLTATAILASIALDRGDSAEFERRLAEAPMDAPSLAALRGKLQLSRGNLPQAIRELKRAHGADPNDRAVLHALGSALKTAGDPVAAEPFLAAARRHDAITPLISKASTPTGAKDPTLPGRLGAACEAAGRLPEAMAWYKIAIRDDPSDRASQQAVFRLSKLSLNPLAPGNEKKAEP